MIGKTKHSDNFDLPGLSVLDEVNDQDRKVDQLRKILPEEM